MKFLALSVVFGGIDLRTVSTAPFIETFSLSEISFS